jgi:hypothetical protein
MRRHTVASLVQPPFALSSRPRHPIVCVLPLPCSRETQRIDLGSFDKYLAMGQAAAGMTFHNSWLAFLFAMLLYDSELEADNEEA